MKTINLSKEITLYTFVDYSEIKYHVDEIKKIDTEVNINTYKIRVNRNKNTKILTFDCRFIINKDIVEHAMEIQKIIYILYGIDATKYNTDRIEVDIEPIELNKLGVIPMVNEPFYGVSNLYFIEKLPQVNYISMPYADMDLVISMLSQIRNSDLFRNDFVRCNLLNQIRQYTNNYCKEIVDKKDDIKKYRYNNKTYCIREIEKGEGPSYIISFTMAIGLGYEYSSDIARILELRNENEHREENREYCKIKDTDILKMLHILILSITYCGTKQETFNVLSQKLYDYKNNFDEMLYYAGITHIRSYFGDYTDVD